MGDTGLTELGLKGRTAIISGSTRGVGLAVAEALASYGVNVALNYVGDDETAKAAVERVQAHGVKAIAVKADVSLPEGATRLAAESASSLGPVDILVNNAHGRIKRTPFLSSTWEEHQAHVEGILKSSYNLTREVFGGMKGRGFGRIVNVGNNMVLEPIKGYSAYTSAMAALLGFTRNLAAEAGPWGVTVNMVSPGFVQTDGAAPHTNEGVRQAILNSTPLGRLAVPEDIAGVVLFLCSNLGRFVTGVNISVDGGKVMG